MAGSAYVTRTPCRQERGRARAVRGTLACTQRRGTGKKRPPNAVHYTCSDLAGDDRLLPCSIAALFTVKSSNNGPYYANYAALSL
jgi:hypothetical protein